MAKLTVKVVIGLVGIASAMLLKSDLMQVIGAFIAGACLDSLIMSKLSEAQRAKLEALLDKEVN